MSENILTLMYHGIIDGASAIPPGREPGAELYDVSSQIFRKQMQCLKRNDFHTVFINDSTAQPDNKSLVITFDDGEFNNYLHALPVLREFAFCAYFFVTVDRIGKNGYMGWDQLKILVQNGMIVGSHGFYHEGLIHQPLSVIQNELTESKRILEYNLKIPIVSFSVPRGFYNQDVLNAAQSAGYRTIFVSQRNQKDSVSIARVAVKKNWSIQRFEQAMRGEIPWQEKKFDAIKNFTKEFLGSKKYNALRSRILNKS